MAKIFLTGITGFLGSNIANYLIEQGHDVIAIYREQSSRKLCANFIERVEWILQDENEEWIQNVVNAAPQIIIHAAWLGVGHEQRDKWESQFLNIDFLKKILFVASKARIVKFIGLGSQAEYGIYNGLVNEDQQLLAFEAYGCVKIICAEMVKQYCTYHKINWYWLRLFSFFGKGESEKWLIPALVKKMVYSDRMDLTLGEQKYTYLYVNDLGLAINKIVNGRGKSDMYNISGKKLITLRYLIEEIRNKINPSFQLDFGKLPYRQNQSMHMQGDCTKFVEEFGEFEVSDFDRSLTETIEYLKKEFNH